MRIIIAGGGVVGTYLSQSLSIDHEIVLIDKNPEICSILQSSSDIMVRESDISFPDIFNDEEIREGQLFIAVTSDDRANIFGALYANRAGIAQSIIRITDTKYMENPLFKDNPGIHIINPEISIAEEIGRVITTPSALRIEELMEGKIWLVQVKMEPNSLHLPKKVKELPLPSSWIFISIERNQEFIIPHGNTKLLHNDKITAIGVPQQFKDFLSSIGTPVEKSEIAIILGAGKIGSYLAKALITRNIQVRVLEKDKRRALNLAEEIPKLMVFHSDGTDTEALVEAGIGLADWFCALTDDDEQNILSSLLAKHLGVKKVVTLLGKPDYAPLLGTLGIDRPVSLKEIAASSVIRFIRRGEIHAASLIAGGKGEILDIEVQEGTPIEGKTLRKIKFPRGTLVGIVLRNNYVFVPRGDYVPKKGDRMVLITLPEEIKNLEKIIS